MTPANKAKIKAFVKERDEVLLAGDVNRLQAFYQKYNPGGPTFPNAEVAEMALHKARTATTTLPMEARLESKRWLSERGYTSMDAGNLTN